MAAALLRGARENEHPDNKTNARENELVQLSISDFPLLSVGCQNERLYSLRCCETRRNIHVS